MTIRRPTAAALLALGCSTACQSLLDFTPSASTIAVEGGVPLDGAAPADAGADASAALDASGPDTSAAGFCTLPATLGGDRKLCLDFDTPGHGIDALDHPPFDFVQPLSNVDRDFVAGVNGQALRLLAKATTETRSAAWFAHFDQITKAETMRYRAKVRCAAAQTSDHYLNVGGVAYDLQPNQAFLEAQVVCKTMAGETWLELFVRNYQSTDTSGEVHTFQWKKVSPTDWTEVTIDLELATSWAAGAIPAHGTLTIANDPKTLDLPVGPSGAPAGLFPRVIAAGIFEGNGIHPDEGEIQIDEIEVSSF